jgi:hypothetical protein
MKAREQTLSPEPDAGRLAALRALPVLNSRQAGELAGGVCPHTIRRWINSEGAPGGGRPCRIPTGDFIAWIEARARRGSRKGS